MRRSELAEAAEANRLSTTGLDLASILFAARCARRLVMVVPWAVEYCRSLQGHTLAVETPLYKAALGALHCVRSAPELCLADQRLSKARFFVVVLLQDFLNSSTSSQPLELEAPLQGIDGMADEAWLDDSLLLLDSQLVLHCCTRLEHVSTLLVSANRATIQAAELTSQPSRSRPRNRITPDRPSAAGSSTVGSRFWAEHVDIKGVCETVSLVAAKELSSDEMHNALFGVLVDEHLTRLAASINVQSLVAKPKSSDGSNDDLDKQVSPAPRLQHSMSA